MGPPRGGNLFSRRDLDLARRLYITWSNRPRFLIINASKVTLPMLKTRALSIPPTGMAELAPNRMHVACRCHASFRGASAALLLLSCMAEGCAIPRASHGLLEHDAPWQTLAPRTTGLEAPTFAVRNMTLPTGLRLAVENAETSGLVGAILTVGVGASQDPHGKEGLAHYLEHLVFRMPVGPGQSLHEALRALGAGALNGSTSGDVTQYQAYVAEEHVPRLLELYAKVLTQPLEGVTEDVATVERRVLHAEEQYRDELGILGKLNGFLHQALFPADHPYSRPMGGTQVSIARLALSDAQSLARQHYRPENATLFLIGKFEGPMAVIAAKLPKALRVGEGTVTPRRVEIRPLPAGAPPRPERGAIFTTARQPGFLMSWRLPAVSTEEGGLVRIATSRKSLGLLERTVDEMGLSSSTSCWPQHLLQTSLLTCWVKLATGEGVNAAASAAAQGPLTLWFPRTESVYSLQARVYERALIQEYTPAELFASMRIRATVNAVFGAEAFADRAEEEARLFHLTGETKLLDKVLAAAIKAPNSAFFEFVRTYLNGDQARFVVAEAQPEAAAASVPESAASRFSDVVALQMNEAPSDALAAMAIPPEFQKLRQFRLDNGLTVVIAPRPQYPVLSVGFGFRGGPAAAKVPGVVTFLREVQDELGTSLYEQAAQQHLHPLVLWTSDRENMTVDMVRAGRGLLPNAFFVLADRLKTIDSLDWRKVFERIENAQAARSHKAWEQDRPGARQQRQGERRSPWQRARVKVAAELYGLPQGEDEEPDQFSDSAFNWENVSGHLTAMHHPKNAILAIVGNVEVAEAERLVRQWFGPWKPEGGYRELSPPASEAPGSGPAREVVVTSIAEAAEHTDLTLACRLPQEDAQTRMVHEALAQVIQHRIFHSLRESSGLSYSPSAGTYGSTDGAAHLAVELEVSHANTKSAVTALRALWQDLDARGFDAPTLAVARWELASQNRLRFQTADGSVLAILDALNRNLPADFEARATQRLARVQIKDIKKAFETCRATTVLSLVGREEIIKSATVK